MELLKLIALDKEDLEIISAHLQDAVVKVDEIVWQPELHRLVVGLNRFDWEAAVAETPAWQRRRSALRFDRVLSFKSRNVQPAEKDKVLNLLALDFAETEAPGGTVTLSFSGDVALRLDVECIESEVVDLGPVWTTTCCPCHEKSETSESEEEKV
jgi:hypothetical protein